MLIPIATLRTIRTMTTPTLELTRMKVDGRVTFMTTITTTADQETQWR
jgi:hypothetical protein